MRTREQIVADCEKRFEELRKEKLQREQNPAVQKPCRTCRWETNDDMDARYVDRWCSEPLVKGFGAKVRVVRCGRRESNPMPCGPEKALWQPKLTACQRIIQFLTGETP